MCAENETSERVENLHIKPLKIVQNPDLFMFGTDAVLVSHFASQFIRNNQLGIDLGCGNGIIPILLSAQSRAKKIDGLELQEESFQLAQKSVRLNLLEEKIRILKGDVKVLCEIFSPQSYDFVISNPPYMIYEPDAQSGKNKSSALSIARHEVCASLKDFVKAASFLLKPRGSFYIVYRPQRLPELFLHLADFSLEPKVMQFIHPMIDRAPTMVLVKAVKGASRELKILPPLSMYSSPGVRTPEFAKIYEV